MAVRKAKTASRSPKGGGGNKKTPAGKRKSYSWAVLFWLAFTILIFGLFLYNREAISISIQAIQKEFAARKTSADEKPSPPLTATPPQTSPPPAAEPARPAPPAQTQVVQTTAVQTAPSSAPPATPPALPAPSPAPVQAPAASTQTQSAPAQTAAPEAPPRQAEHRERSLYFTQVDRDGTILRIRVNRNIPVSDSPMTDVVQALVAGPTGEERNRGLISLIPPDTKILSATVRGDTAYISFSEEFQYNTYGVEGYAGQIRQVVFTVTEFPNIRNVQILIEGRRVDFLGEGVWIGSPLNRERF